MEAGDWDSAVNMYRGNNNWEEAYTCAREHGGAAAGNKVAYAWALTLGGEAGSKLLTKLVRARAAPPSEEGSCAARVLALLSRPCAITVSTLSFAACGGFDLVLLSACLRVVAGHRAL